MSPRSSIGRLRRRRRGAARERRDRGGRGGKARALEWFRARERAHEISGTRCRFAPRAEPLMRRARFQRGRWSAQFCCARAKSANFAARSVFWAPVRVALISSVCAAEETVVICQDRQASGNAVSCQKGEERRQMQPRTLPRGLAAVLRAVTGCRGRREEQALHCLVCKLGLASDVVLATALLVRYGKRGLLAPAQRLFDEMLGRDAAAFNAMLAALGASGRAADARRLFDRMPEPDRTPASWNTMLTCYCRTGNLASARAVFEASLRAAMSSVVSWNAMIDGYCKAGRMDAARELFDRMGSSARDVVTYNTMMAGYLRRGDPAATIAMFRRLTQQDDQQTPRPTAVTIATLVTACTQVGDFAFGRAVHLSTRQLLETSTDAVLSNALMDMYFKCGSVDLALEVFTTMPGAPNLFCWNTVIAGLGRNGRGEEAVRAFRDMVEASKKRNEVTPDSVTFVALLSACSHSGLVREGRELFAEMLPAHGVAPGAEHYGCMVDLLCRAGLLGEAVRLVRTMPVRPNAKVLGCLLLHARSSGDGEVDGVTASEWAAKRITELDVRDGAAYGLSNLYASLQRWDHVERHRSGLVSTAVASRKEPGRTSYDPHVR